MSKVPVHVHRLSAIYWEIVDKLIENGFTPEDAEGVTRDFFNHFKPLPRNKEKEQEAEEMLLDIEITRQKEQE